MYSSSMSIADQLQEAVSGTQLKGKARMYTDAELSAQLDLVEKGISRPNSKFWADPKHREAGAEIISELRRRFDLSA